MIARSNVILNGYKQTEVGVIPDDWDVARLGDIGSVIRGSSPRPKGDRRFYGGDVPRLMVEDVTRDGKYVVPQVDFLTVEGAKRSRPCKRGTLTIVCSGTVGVASFLGIDACIHDGFLALINITKRVHDDYLYHQLNRLREEFDNSATHGGVFTNLTTFGVRDFRVPVPRTLAEQEAIAEALGNADALIESLEQLVAKKRHLKQAAMQQLLTGKKRLPGFEGESGCKQTEAGVIPEDWDAFELGDIGRFKNGINKDSDSFGHGTPFVNLMDVFGVNSIASSEHLGLVACSNADRASYDLRRGDVIFVRSSVKPSGVGLTALVEADLPETVYSGFLIRFRDNHFLDARFKKYCFYEEGFRNRLIGNSSVSANTNISQDSLKRLTIGVPRTETEQAAIAAVLSDMDTAIEAIEAKLSKARQIKQGMMQELLTGRIRLVQPQSTSETHREAVNE